MGKKPSRIRKLKQSSGEDIHIDFQENISALVKRLSSEKKSFLNKLESLASENYALKEEIGSRDFEIKRIEQECLSKIRDMQEEFEEDKKNSEVQIKELHNKVNIMEVDSVNVESALSAEFEDKIHKLEKDKDSLFVTLVDIKDRSYSEKSRLEESIRKIRDKCVEMMQASKEKEKKFKEESIEAEYKLKELRKKYSNSVDKHEKDREANEREIQSLKMELARSRAEQEAALRLQVREKEQIRVSAAKRAIKELEQKMFRDYVQIEE